MHDKIMENEITFRFNSNNGYYTNKKFGYFELYDMPYESEEEIENV